MMKFKYYADYDDNYNNSYYYFYSYNRLNVRRPRKSMTNVYYTPHPSIHPSIN